MDAAWSLITYLALATALFVAVGAGARAGDPTMRIVVQDVDVTAGWSPHDAIPPNFVGFSLESYSVQKAMFPAYAALLELLHNASVSAGPRPGPVIRIGGDSADQACWWPRTAAQSPSDPAFPCQRNLTAADIAAYRAFADTTAAGANISFVIGTNLKQANPLLGAAHVAGIGAGGLWHRVSGIEVGNEVDHWSPGQLSFKDYEAGFAGFVAAYKAAGMPAQPRVQGAVFCCFNPEFMLGLGPYSRKYATDLKSISFHRYSTSHCSDPHEGANAVLTRQASKGQGDLMRVYANAVKPLPLWAGEANSASCGGAPNVSDTFASSLWALDFLSELSKAGVAGVNLHGGPHAHPETTSDSYSPVAFDDAGRMTVRPLFYGLWAWAEFAGNRSVWVPNAAVTVEGLGGRPPNSYAHVVTADGPVAGCRVLRVLVIAKDMGQTGNLTVTVTLPAGFCSSTSVAEPHLSGGRAGRSVRAGAATLRRLLAPAGIAATQGVQWGGQRLSDANGRVLGVQVIEQAWCRDGEVVVALPALSAAVLTVPGPCTF